MDYLTPLFGVLAFSGVIAVILGLGWFLRNKTSLGEFGVGKSSFVLNGSYRLDSKTKLHVFTVDGDRFVAMTSPTSICLIDKSHSSSRAAVDHDPEGSVEGKFADHLNRVSAG